MGSADKATKCLALGGCRANSHSPLILQAVDDKSLLGIDGVGTRVWRWMHAVPTLKMLQSSGEAGIRHTPHTRRWCEVWSPLWRGTNETMLRCEHPWQVTETCASGQVSLGAKVSIGQSLELPCPK